MQRSAFPDQVNRWPIVKPWPAAGACTTLEPLNALRLIGVFAIPTLIPGIYLLLVSRMGLTPAEDWPWFLSMLFRRAAEAMSFPTGFFYFQLFAAATMSIPVRESDLRARLHETLEELRRTRHLLREAARHSAGSAGQGTATACRGSDPGHDAGGEMFNAWNA